MWTRSLLKSNAKQALQERYWRSVGLCLLLSLLGIGYSFPRLTAQYRVTSSQLNGMMSGPVWQGNAGGGYTSGNEEYLLQALAPFAGGGDYRNVDRCRNRPMLGSVPHQPADSRPQSLFYGKPPVGNTVQHRHFDLPHPVSECC